jgi:hypothetical protein
MNDYQSLATQRDCKYHVVFIPKCRRKTLYGELRRHLGEIFRRLAMQKECRIEEGHLMPDHVHMMISIPPKYAVSQVVGVHQGQERDPPGSGLWGEEARLDQMKLLALISRLQAAPIHGGRVSDPGSRFERPNS